MILLDTLVGILIDLMGVHKGHGVGQKKLEECY